MEHYRRSSHTVYDLKYHLVWITKYRKPVLKGHISRDHVHIFVSVPPHFSMSNLLNSIKGKTSRKVLIEFKALNRQFWGRHLWTRGYFAATSGNVTHEVVMQYIEQQGKEPIDGDFKVDGEDL